MRTPVRVHDPEERERDRDLTVPESDTDTVDVPRSVAGDPHTRVSLCLGVDVTSLLPPRPRDLRISTVPGKPSFVTSTPRHPVF